MELKKIINFEMNDLESILKKYNASEITVFTANGKFTPKGYNTYCDFCSMLYDVAALTNSFDAEQVEKELDKIVEFAN